MIKEGGFDGKTKLWMLDNVKCLHRGGGVASWTLIVSIDAADHHYPLFVATSTVVISSLYLMTSTVSHITRKRKGQKSSQFQFHL